MRTRFLLLGTIVGALTLFCWQSLSNTVIPWHMATVRMLENDSAAVQAVRAAMPQNGVWLSTRGVVAAVALRPDLGDKSAEMGGMLARQLLLDLAVAFVLCLLVLRLPAVSATAMAANLGLAALAFSGILAISDSIWYGFTFPYAAVNVIDMTVNGLLAGLALGAMRNRMARNATAGVRAPETAGMGMGEGVRR
jgi:hypothetical protein